MDCGVRVSIRARALAGAGFFIVFWNDRLDFAPVFVSEDLRADFNRNGQIDFFDYLDFVQAFDAICEP
jgi:hypothetical protein